MLWNVSVQSLPWTFARIGVHTHTWTAHHLSMEARDTSKANSLLSISYAVVERYFSNFLGEFMSNSSTPFCKKSHAWATVYSNLRADAVWRMLSRSRKYVNDHYHDSWFNNLVSAWKPMGNKHSDSKYIRYVNLSSLRYFVHLTLPSGTSNLLGSSWSSCNLTEYCLQLQVDWVHSKWRVVSQCWTCMNVQPLNHLSLLSNHTVSLHYSSMQQGLLACQFLSFDFLHECFVALFYGSFGNSSFWLCQISCWIFLANSNE